MEINSNLELQGSVFSSVRSMEWIHENLIFTEFNIQWGYNKVLR